MTFEEDGAVVVAELAELVEAFAEDAVGVVEQGRRGMPSMSTWSTETRRLRR